MYNLILNTVNGIMTFTDWEKQTIDYLKEHKNIKKVWLVNKQRKTGATYFAKLLLYFRPMCTKTFVLSNNLDWSRYISRHMPIEFHSGVHRKDSVWYKASNFLIPVTLYGLEKEIEKDKPLKDFFESFNKTPFKDFFESFKTGRKVEYECLYDGEFDIEKYKTLCSYNFKFFIVNVSPKDLEKARPFIEADKDKEDVLIVNIENTLFPQIYENE